MVTVAAGVWCLARSRGPGVLVADLAGDVPACAGGGRDQGPGAGRVARRRAVGSRGRVWPGSSWTPAPASRCCPEARPDAGRRSDGGPRGMRPTGWPMLARMVGADPRPVLVDCGGDRRRARRRWPWPAAADPLAAGRPPLLPGAAAGGGRRRSHPSGRGDGGASRVGCWAGAEVGAGGGRRSVAEVATWRSGGGSARSTPGCCMRLPRSQDRALRPITRPPRRGPRVGVDVARRLARGRRPPPGPGGRAGGEPRPCPPPRSTGLVRACGPLLPACDVEAIVVARVLARTGGLGPLEPLLADASVTEVMVNGPGPVWVERGGPPWPAPTVVARHRR